MLWKWVAHITSIHHEYVPAGHAVTGQYYVGILKHLWARFLRVWPKLTKKGWILHNDKVPAHSSFIVQVFGEIKHSNIKTPTLVK